MQPWAEDFGKFAKPGETVEYVIRGRDGIGKEVKVENTSKYKMWYCGLDVVMMLMSVRYFFGWCFFVSGVLFGVGRVGSCKWDLQPKEVRNTPLKPPSVVLGCFMLAVHPPR